MPNEVRPKELDSEDLEGVVTSNPAIRLKNQITFNVNCATVLRELKRLVKFQ